MAPHHAQRRTKAVGHAIRSGLPTAVGLALALTILLVSAGATVFLLTKPADDERLYQEGLRELANGQYAFAVKSLEQAVSQRPHDAKVFLSLARAYVGIDQVDKAWDCISQAQQLGTGVVAEPALASDLANYYRQREKYERAVELLRPLAQSGVPGKKAELADLDALWGDEALRSGDLDRALKCWEEVREIREGSRFTEAEARLATIYQKITNNLINNRDDNKALAYLTKLNTIAENAGNYVRAAEIYERRGQLELAIDQLRRAIKISARNPEWDRHLASLMSRRGKELLDSGDSQTGYAYLQQARSLDPGSVVPATTVRNINISLDPSSHLPRLSGEIWNPGPNVISYLTLKLELWDTVSAHVLWEREQKIIDEFVPPLAVQEAKPFDALASVPVKENGLSEFRVYLDGQLYKSYPIGQKSQSAETKTAGAAESTARTGQPGQPAEAQKPEKPPAGQADSLPIITPAGQPEQPRVNPRDAAQKNAEDQTLKDLEF